MSDPVERPSSDPVPGPSSRTKSFMDSPPKKRPRTSHLTENEKTIALNIYKYVHKTMSTYPYKKEVVKTTSTIMGVSVSCIESILREYRSTGMVSSPPETRPAHRKIIKDLDEFLLDAIRRKVHQFYFDNEMPTIDKVLAAVNCDDDMPTFSRMTMYRIMKKLNFVFTKRSRRSILLDRPDLIVWRKQYIMKIKDYRKENKKIYYMDETWVNAGHTTNAVWAGVWRVDNDIESSRQAFLRGLSTGLKNPQKGKRLIVTHMGSTEGFLDEAKWIFEAKKSEGDYHGEMDAHNFEKWFEGVLQKIEPGSVIVLDNAPYHSRQIDRLPNMSWRKDAIQAWLREKNIDFEENEIKAILLTKIDKNKYKKKYIDALAASRNVSVLRLPPYHCELNPIELIWAQAKTYVARNNKTFKLADVKRLLEEGIAKIGAAEWQKCIEHVIKVEDKMMSLDGIIDNLTDTIAEPFIIHVSENESDSEISDEINQN